MKLAALLMLMLMLLVACGSVRGPCTRKETVTVEVDCREGGHSGSVRVPPVIQH